MFFGAVGAVSAGGVTEEERLRAEILATLSMAEREYAVVVAAVVDERADPAGAGALGSYAEILRDALLEVPRRYLPDDERRAIREARIAEELNEARLSRDARLQELERGSIATPAERDPVDRAEDKPLAELDGRIAALETIEPWDVTLPPVVPVDLLDLAPVFRRGAPDPEVMARETGADLLFTLIVEELGELRMLTIYGYLSALDQNEVLGRVISEPENLPTRFEENLPGLLAALTARELGSVSVRVVGADGLPDVEARIRLDGRLIGVGEAEEGYLPVGEYTLSASRSDGRSVARRISISEGELYTVTLAIPAVSAPPVTLLSRPAGAAVYEGAIWRGYTPLALPRPIDQVEYRIVGEGYHESRLSLTQDTPPVVERVLIDIDYDWEAQVESDRRRFYRSFGAFAVSLAGPILINGALQNLTGLYPTGVPRSDLSTEEQDDLENQVDTLVYAYYGSLALSSGLFGHMIWRLVQYVQTAGEYHRR